MKELNLRERRELLETMALCPYNLRPNEPFFRHWNKLPERVRDGLSQLKSDDIKDINWHLRY